MKSRVKEKWFCRLNNYFPFENSPILINISVRTSLKWERIWNGVNWLYNWCSREDLIEIMIPSQLNKRCGWKYGRVFMENRISLLMPITLETLTCSLKTLPRVLKTLTCRLKTLPCALHLSKIRLNFFDCIVWLICIWFITITNKIHFSPLLSYFLLNLSSTCAYAIHPNTLI